MTPKLSELSIKDNEEIIDNEIIPNIFENDEKKNL